MIRAVFIPDALRPGAGRQVWEVEAGDGLTAGDLFSECALDAETFVVSRNGERVDFGASLDDGDVVVGVQLPGVDIAAYVVVSLIISTATGLISQALLPGVEQVGDPEETAPTYGYGGQIKSSRREGAPIGLGYGEFRAGGQVIAEFVENRRGSSFSSVYAVQISFGEGPIESIGGFSRDTADDEVLRSGLSTQRLPLDGVFVNGNEANALSEVEAQIRLGSDEQSPAAGFEFTGTPTFSGAELLAPEWPNSNPVAPVANIIDPQSTSQVEQDQYWSDYGEAVALPAGTYDAARVTVTFPSGAYIIPSGTAIGRVYLNLLVRYIELDEFGADITTGGNFNDGWVRLPPEVYAYQTRSQVATDFVFPFYDPATFSPILRGNAASISGTEGTPNSYRLTCASGSISKPAGWSAGSTIEALTVEAWVKVSSFESGVSGNETRNLIAGLYDFEVDGWTLSLERKTFNLAPGAAVVRWVPVLGFHNGGAREDYFEGRVDSLTGVGAPTFTVVEGEWFHVAVTFERNFNGIRDRFRIFANGALVGEVIQNVDPTHADEDFLVGKFVEEGRSFLGVIDELIVYDEVRSDLQVAQSYNQGVGTYHEAEGSMVFAYHFDGDALDFSGNGNDLTGSGGTGNGGVGADGLVFLPTSNTLKPGRYRVEVAKNNLAIVFPAAQDIPTLDSVSGLIDGAFSYPGSPVLSLKIGGSEEVNGSAPNVTARCKFRHLPVWDGDSVESPTFTRRFSRNLSWAVVDMLTLETNALGREVGVSRVDVVSFQEFANYCDEWLEDLRGISRDSVDDGDSNGWTDLLYSPSTVDARTGELRGSITIFFGALADIPSHWTEGAGVIFTGTPATSVSGMLLDISAPNMDGFEIAFINRSDVNPFVQVYYDRVDQGAPWDDPGGYLSTSISPTDPTGTVEGAERRHFFDAFIDTAERGWETVVKTLSLGRAVPVIEGDTVRVKIRRPRNPVGFVGMGNIIPGTFEVNYVDTSSNPNFVLVDFKDGKLNFDDSVEFFRHSSSDETDASTTVEDTVKGFGISRRCQAKRHAAYLARVNREVKRRGSFEVGPDGMHFEVADLIYLSHDLIPWGKGGRVTAASAAGAATVMFDREIVIESGRDAFVRIRNEATSQMRNFMITDPPGTYPRGTAINLSTPIPFDVPVGGLFHYYQEGDLVVADITAVTLTAELGIRIEWVEYVAGVYSDDVGLLSSQSVSRGQQNSENDSIIPPNVELLSASEQRSRGGSSDDIPRVQLTWRSADSTPKPAGFSVWVRTEQELYRRVAEVGGDSNGVVVDLPAGTANETVHFVVQQLARDGSRRSPELCAHTAIVVVGAGARPAPPTNFAADFTEDTVTYSWDLPDDSASLVVEARAGGWELGRVIFTSGRGDRSFGPSRDWSAGRITVRSMNSAGAYSEPLIFDLDTSEVERDTDATDVDPLLGDFEWSGYEDGWIDDGDNSSPKPVVDGLQRTDDGFLEFAPGELVGTYTSSDPTTSLGFVRTRRELYVEANCLAFQVVDQAVDLSTFSAADIRASAFTPDGFAHNRSDFGSGVTLKVEARVAREGVGWSDWRDFHPGLVQAVAVQFRITATRIDEAHNIEIRSLRTSVASKVPSLYDITPNDLYLRSEL